MSKKYCPRLARWFGVETKQKFRIAGYAGEFWIDNDGMPNNLELKDNPARLLYAVVEAIELPGLIRRIHQLSDAELAICKGLGAKWLRWQEGTTLVELYAEKPYYLGGEGQSIAFVAAEAMPSVRKGDCIDLEEEIGDE